MLQLSWNSIPADMEQGYIIAKPTRLQ